MHLDFRNVNDAFYHLVKGIHYGDIPTVRAPSRAGDVLKIPEPVLVSYRNPAERVLFNQNRDCNHFFHLFEALWMLTGRNDVEPLAFYLPRMRDFSDDGATFHGAYGHRWRCLYHHQTVRWDQLGEIIHNLREDPSSRREVLQVWDGRFDLMCRPEGAKDLPCNTHAYFAVVDDLRLDMTVCNRSNDIIWGMLGANVVHWSLLQEYMACSIGVEVGTYHQFTNNAHVYLSRWSPEAWLDTAAQAEYPSLIDSPHLFSGYPNLSGEERRRAFDAEVSRFVSSNGRASGEGFQGVFLGHVAQPMMAAFRAHKQRRYLGDLNAFELAERIAAPDWRVAAKQWLEKRYSRWRER